MSHQNHKKNQHYEGLQYLKSSHRVIHKLRGKYLEIRNNNKKKGFSLIEAVISLFVLAIILEMASVSFMNLAPKYRLQNAIWEIHSRMNYARYKAIFKTTKVRIKFSTRSYSIEEFDLNEKKWVKERINFLEGVIIQANNSPTFHPEGTVSNLASIIVSNSWGKYKITLAISGRIKVVKL